MVGGAGEGTKMVQVSDHGKCNPYQLVNRDSTFAPSAHGVFGTICRVLIVVFPP